MRAEDISDLRTQFSGITLLSLDKNNVFKFNSTRHVEALLLDEDAAVELLDLTTTEGASCFKSLDGVDELEKYMHLSQLLHIQKAVRDKK